MLSAFNLFSWSSEESDSFQVTHDQAHVEWKIKDISLLPFKSCEYIDSPPFRLSDEEWFLRIYPQSLEIFTSINLHLLKKCISSQKHRLAFTLGIKRVDGSVHESMIFEHDFHHAEEHHEPFVFDTGGKLLFSKDTVLTNDTLTVFCTVQLVAASDVKEAASQTPITHLTDINVNSTNFNETSQTSTENHTVNPLNASNMKYAASQTSTAYCSDFYVNASNINETASQISTACCSACHLNVSTRMDGIFQTSSPERINTLSQNLKDLLVKGCHSDVTIKVQNREFQAHRSILAARSSVFESMFKLDMVEKDSGVVNIDDCEPDIVQDFLLFVYTGNVNHVTSVNMAGLFKIADKYDLKELKDTCISCMSCEQTIDSVCDTITIAVVYNESELFAIATDFFINNMKAVLQTTKWMSLIVENPSLANQLLIKAASVK